MQVKTTNNLRLSDFEIFCHYLDAEKDEDYRSVMQLLPYACLHSYKKANAFIEKAKRTGKRFYAHYPDFDKTDVSKFEFIGDIMDGALYITR